MMTLGQFKSQTGYDSDSNAGAVVRGVLGRQRGSNLAVIDAALSSYDLLGANGNPLHKAQALEHVVIACQWWLKLKASKIGVKTETTNTDTRAQVIQTLKAQAIQELTALSAARAAFAANKAAAISLGTVEMKTSKQGLTKKGEVTGTVPLAQGYQHERKSYLDTDKNTAISASTVYGNSNLGHDTSYKTFKKCYDKMVTEGGGDLNVAYLPKTDRLDYLLVCQNGVFSYANGAKPKSSIGSGAAEPYAIDRYGNFFSTQLGTVTSKGKLFNHSCFTAGTPVLCAGMCQFDANGHLHHIDNDSGHYKPSRQALFAAVNLVISQGVNGAELRVKVKGANGAVDIFMGTTFAANVNAAVPDWNPALNAQFGLA